jgi:hypothetical protein
MRSGDAQDSKNPNAASSEQQQRCDKNGKQQNGTQNV